MKFGYALLGLIALAIAGVIGWTISLEPKWNIQHSISVNKKPAEIWPQLAGLKNWENWSVFHPDFVDDLKLRYSGPDEGVGSTMHWSMPSSNGITTITKAQLPNLLEYETVSGDGAFHGYGEIKLSATSDGSEVSWTYRGDSGGNLILRGFMADLIPQMDRGNQISLRMLKLQAE